MRWQFVWPSLVKTKENETGSFQSCITITIHQSSSIIKSIIRRPQRKMAMMIMMITNRLLIVETIPINRTRLRGEDKTRAIFFLRGKTTNQQSPKAQNRLSLPAKKCLSYRYSQRRFPTQSTTQPTALTWSPGGTAPILATKIVLFPSVLYRAARCSSRSSTTRPKTVAPGRKRASAMQTRGWDRSVHSHAHTQ